MMMKRKTYKTPTTQVVILQQHYRLLSGSPKGSLDDGEGDPEEEDWD